jgi:two-component system phosphate regulon sensor histidine kinase PhoR
LKQLKGLDIASRVLINFKENLFYTRVFAKDFIILGLTLFITLTIFDDHYFSYWLTLLIFFLILSLTIVSIGNKRKQQIRLIQKAIDDIRTNKLKKPEEIDLGSQLPELEADIKAMFLKTQFDISNLKKLEQVRTEFLGNVSHELRTPIFAIQGYLETLLNGAIDDHKVNKNFLQKAYHHTNNLNNLLHDLIDISMIESGQMKMSFQYFNVKSFLVTIVQDFSLLAEEKEIGLFLGEIDPELELYGDKARLRQALNNLISNAIKYADEGRVDVLVNSENDFSRIIVKDTGFGILESDLNRIFERFYRVDKDRSRAVGGTGLGLAIVKHIVEAHNSKIDVKSTPGKGSEFSFLLKKKSNKTILHPIN